MFVTESVQNFSQLCILLYMALHTCDIFYGTLGGIFFVVHIVKVVQMSTHSTEYIFNTH